MVLFNSFTSIFIIIVVTVSPTCPLINELTNERTGESVPQMKEALNPEHGEVDASTEDAHESHGKIPQ
jgi:hypothetical protein